MSTQRRSRIPSYRLHRPSGLAVVTIRSRDIYVGEHDTHESRAKYDRLIAEWLLEGRQSANVPRDNPADLRVSELCLSYREWATVYYRKLDGVAAGV
jgi:hypothetical protein